MEGGQNSNVIRTSEEVDSNFDGFETQWKRLTADIVELTTELEFIRSGA